MPKQQGMIKNGESRENGRKVNNLRNGKEKHTSILDVIVQRTFHVNRKKYL
jgi:hypothetical protein